MNYYNDIADIAFGTACIFDRDDRTSAIRAFEDGDIDLFDLFTA